MEKTEYSSTRELFVSCFGNDEEFMDEFYGSTDAEHCCTGVIRDGLIAVLELDGTPVSMVQVLLKHAEAAGTAFTAPYIMGVCTLPEFRHRGFMDRVMNAVIARLKEDGYPWCFLIAVDRDIYRHLDFCFDQKLTDAECELLYADDGLDTASIRLLNNDRVEPFHICS